MGKGLWVHIETAVFDGCRSRILCCQEQIGRDKIRLLYGVITSSSAGKVQRSGDLLQTTDLENIIAVIAIRGPGAFAVTFVTFMPAYLAVFSDSPSTATS